MDEKPTLEYRWLSHDGDAVILDGPHLHTVREVSCWESDGVPEVWARGRMRKRDGEPGPSRGGRVNVSAPQPAWLRRIIDDASDRLSLPPAVSTELAEQEAQHG